MVAMKIHKSTEGVDLIGLKKEIEILQALPHQNLISLLGFFPVENIMIKTQDGWMKHSEIYFVVVLELAEGSDLI